MDQVKIGKFIQEKRKEKNLTQLDLADKLNVTDRAVSKWENGICLPDAGTMPELCKLLNISINDLFSGEVVNMKENEKKLEEHLLEITRIKEEKDKLLLALEYVISFISVISFLVLTLLAEYLDIENWLRILLIVIAFIILLFGAGNAIKIEQIAGLYKCSKCEHKYVPSYLSVFWAMHFGRTRYMKCPKCGKWSWNKKVLK